MLPSPLQWPHDPKAHTSALWHRAAVHGVADHGLVVASTAHTGLEATFPVHIHHARLVATTGALQVGNSNHLTKPKVNATNATTSHFTVRMAQPHSSPAA
jgi:hypothetical protein